MQRKEKTNWQTLRNFFERALFSRLWATQGLFLSGTLIFRFKKRDRNGNALFKAAGIHVFLVLERGGAGQRNVRAEESRCLYVFFLAARFRSFSDKFPLSRIKPRRVLLIGRRVLFPI